ncbi:hypothetical protein JG687_00016224 [Phytophthora cactorum]|uniref:Uncharacterized protein n=1 Tax=Phytophthora cactorum TaxID=29920 RepID=A0A8T1TR87_9STRA|nr:hypothetical protein JG687_00016224 [Phytophthora cactorum]
MERRSRVSAVDEDLELAERSPSPPMLPPFRRPAAPPPPPPSTTAPRRSLGDSLPRRSLLAPEVARPSDEDYAHGRDSDERKSAEEPENEKPRDRRPRKKRRSRIISELRPVDGPGSALPSVPAINDDDSQVSDDPLEAPDSGERAKEVFTAQRVRIKKSWCPDLRIYMKNAHPLFGICAAHRHHPYKRGDRFLVLLVALLVAVLLCGLFAIRDCCTQVLEVPVTVVNRRLEMAQDTRPSILDERMECVAFYEDCSGVSAVCAQGSTCRDSKDTSIAAQCVPDETPSQKCVIGSCPTGWTCNASTSECTPASTYVCYFPVSGRKEERSELQFAAESNGTFRAIEALFQIPQIAADSATSSVSRSQEKVDRTRLQPRSPTSLLAISSSSSSDLASNSSSSSGDSSQSSSTANASSNSDSSSQLASNSTSESASGSQLPETATVKVTMTEPLNGEVYSLSSTMLVEWHVTLLSGPDPGLDKFRVDFSADNGEFDTIAANISTPSSSQDANTTVYQYEWDLADNISWLCTTCVLKICALDVESVSDNSLCIRSDGKSASNQSNRRLQSAVQGSDSGDVTFRIVREAFECSCGLSHKSFLLAAVIIGVCIPVVVLLAEPLVTFYRDRQLLGLFARRDGPARPVIARYSAKSATRKGRVVLVLVLLGLCVACGFVAAQITTTNFLTETRVIIVLWVVAFAIAVALGVLVYCTLLWFVLFTVRWWGERARERESSGLNQFRNSLLSDDVNAKNNNAASPMSTGWTMRGSEGEEYRMTK